MQMTIHVENVNRCLTEERASVAAGLGGTGGTSSLLEPGLYLLVCYLGVQILELLTMNSGRVNSSGRVEEPEPEPEVGAGAAAEVAAAEVAAAEVAAAEVAAAEVASAAAEVAAADDAAAVLVGVEPEPEPEAPSQTAGPGMGYSVLPE